ncbi:CmpA/NrtA family ABC transporter substrate-binding protein [Halioglobus pacificus]|uniref:Nitrate transporter n=1 Tax=Parahalioglobus pacificus TaxID=930806 RepID=A0A918XF84_9GAMM|nr:CmpA/NrtA family ABC transporter substrate-binding protein [Halioglobus pacificus]GHD27931.1 nitrate transporter [Halioglobus pacificus]
MTQSNNNLPAPEVAELDLGYIRLSDSAPLVLAQELGFYEKYQLNVTLHREVSWANLRDKLVVGSLDATQMLAPLPMTTALGAGGLRANLLTGLVLSLNGNGITLSRALADNLAGLGGSPGDAAGTSAALAELLNTQPSLSLTLAAAHSFSCHILQLRLWLRAGGIDPDSRVRIIVLPPEQMVDSLARGIIDGYCVGEPWNTAAVQRGIGTMVTSGFSVWNNLPEKVLGVTDAWHQANPASHLRLRLALMETCQWLAIPENRPQAARALADPQYLDLPERELLPSLCGKLQYQRDGAVMDEPDFHVFGRYQAGFPWRSTARELLDMSMEMLGGSATEAERSAVVQQSYRPDLYRQAARHLGITLPATDNRPAAAHDAPWQMAPGVEMGADLRLAPLKAGGH